MTEGAGGLLRDTGTRVRHRFEHRVEGGRREPRRRLMTRWQRLGRLTQEPPLHEATHWTIRAMGRAVGLAASTVRGIWKSHGLCPHRWRQVKLSNDRAFARTLHDVVALYVAPPAHAVVLSVEE